MWAMAPTTEERHLAAMKKYDIRFDKAPDYTAGQCDIFTTELSIGRAYFVENLFFSEFLIQCCTLKYWSISNIIKLFIFAGSRH